MHLNRRQFIATLAAASIGGHRVLADVSNKPSSSSIRPCLWQDGVAPRTIAVVGDLQRTSSYEQLFLSRSQNDAEREQIFSAIAEEKPDMLLLLGDQVFEGDSNDDWRHFDRLIRGVNDAGVPVRAMLGNHDYGRDLALCRRNFSARFPAQANSIHQLTRLGSVALITLNSNLDQLDSDQIRRQEEEYVTWLGELDDDPSVLGVIVASHHPPYTNSDLGNSPEVISMFATPFLRARKTRLYLSGHAHTYERFSTGDKMFVVSGGGGGPRRSVSIAPNRPNQNDLYRVGTLRPFHYVRLHIEGGRIRGEVPMIAKGGREFVVGDTFDLGLYPSATVAAR
jgi:Icc-related predicted phosphoesterase